MRTLLRYKAGEAVTAEIDGIQLSGRIIAVNPELNYMIELPDGGERSVDHCHILGENQWQEEFILGMTDVSMGKPESEAIVEFLSKEEADESSSEWCIVRAQSLEKAKEIYFEVYDAWYQQGFEADYPSEQAIEEARKRLSDVDE